MDALPRFTYFDDPVKAKSVVESDETCDCCRRARGWIYEGTIYGDHDEPSVCPWCISDGTVARAYPGSFFNDPESPLPKDIHAEVAERTPGFATWQELSWPCCCNDACVFRGYAQYEDLVTKWPEAGKVLQAAYEEGELGTESFEEFLELFRAESDPGAYAFQCRHCKKWQVPWDIS